jgi:hypothetical protein
LKLLLSKWNLRKAAVTAIESQRYNPDIESVDVDHESYKYKLECENRLSESLSQRLSAQSYATAIVTERLNASNLRMSTLPLAQLNELLALDASGPATLLREALHDQRDYTNGLKFSKGEFSKWNVAGQNLSGEKDKLNMQSFARIVSPGLCISSAEQSEAKALEEVWEKTKGLIYKPNPPLMMAGIDVAKKDVIPKKTNFKSKNEVFAVDTHASMARKGKGRGSSSVTRYRSSSPIKKRPRLDVLAFNGTPTFWLHYAPQREEFMDRTHSAWGTPMTSWACPSTDIPGPVPWNTKCALDVFKKETCDRWRQGFTVMCEAHTTPENIIDECYDVSRRGSSFEWLHQPMNRQRPPQNVQQLLQGNLFPQTLRLPDPNDSYNGSIRRHLTDERTLSYLRVVLKPNKRYHGSDYTRPERENARTPGFNDKVQYKPGAWQGYAGQRHPTYPEAADLFNRSGISNKSLRRSTLPMSDPAFLHRVKNELKHGEGREMMYHLYQFLPACMVDIKGHLRDLNLEQSADHFMSPWKYSALLSYSSIIDDEGKPHRITSLDVPNFLVLTFGEKYGDVTFLEQGRTPTNWAEAPEQFPLDDLYCDVEEWLYKAERCMMETSLRIHCAWSELHYVGHERHCHRIKTLYILLSRSFDLISFRDNDSRPEFHGDLWR